MKISASLFAVAAAVPAKDPKQGKFVQDPDAPRLVCGGEITDDAIITSPGFDDPGYYTNNLDCTWEINIAGVSGFMIYPEVFEVEEHYNCIYDSLNISWQEEDEFPLANSTGTAFNYKFCSIGYDWENFEGFSTHTSTQSTSTQTTSTSYYDSSGSSWSTTAYPTSTSTEYDYPSGGDYYDSYGSSSSSYYSSGSSGYSSSGSSGYSSSSSSSSSSYSGSGRKRRAPVEGTLNNSAASGGDGRSTSLYIGDFAAPLEVTGGRATIRFQTDSSVILPGFKLRIEKGNSIEPEGCDQVQFGSGSVSSPSFPENYGDNELCKYTLHAEPGKMIKITFDKFDVESQKYCNYDSLSILGRKHCGEVGSRSNRMPMSEVVIQSDSTELVWETDGSVTHGGFSFTWESVENPIQTELSPLESAQGFHEHMELFLSQIVYQMEFRRPHMVDALRRFWDKISITEEYFQTSGSCDWSYSTPTYQPFDFKDFDENVSQCENLENFANNAEQFVESFVCMDEHLYPKRTFVRWMKMANNIHRLVDRKNSQNICD